MGFASLLNWPHDVTLHAEVSDSAAHNHLATSFLDAPPRQVITCQTKGADVHFDGQLARVVCPAHCDQVAGAVAYGASVHPMRSPVCLAALADHALPHVGGELLVTKLPGLKSYSGVDKSVRNAVATMPSDNEEGEAFHTYPFHHMDMPPKFDRSMQCWDTFSNLGLDHTGDTVIVRCPPSCRQHWVFGTSVYTPDSSVCRAAEHSGVIGDEGGRVVVIRAHGQDAYFGSTSGPHTSRDSHYTRSGYMLAPPVRDVPSSEQFPAHDAFSGMRVTTAGFL